MPMTSEYDFVELPVNRVTGGFNAAEEDSAIRHSTDPHRLASKRRNPGEGA